MTTFMRYTALVIPIWLLLSGICFGKQVYLRDGGYVECRSFRLRGNLVVVNINRDTVIEFERKEVNLRRTLHSGGNKNKQLIGSKPVVAVQPQTAAKVASKPAAVPEPVKPPVTPAVKPAAAPASPAKPVSPPLVPPPAVKPVPPPATPAPAAKESPPPEPAAKAEPAPSTVNADPEQQRKLAAEQMAEAMRKNDPELMKKAIQTQKAALPQKKPLDTGTLIAVVVVSLVIIILLLASMWIVYEKCGEDGWKSLIPFYNTYILMLISGKPGWWFLLLLIPFVGVVFYFLAMISLADRFGKGALFGVGLFLLPIIFFPILAFSGAQIQEFQFFDEEQDQ